MSAAFKHQIWFGLVLLATVLNCVYVGGTQACIEDFSPCNCYDYDGTIGVQCLDVNGTDIRSAFARPTSITHLDSLFIRLPTDCGSFPADMLSGKSASLISIDGLNCDSLLVDSNAFSSTANRTEAIDFSSLSLKYLDFAFLDGFSVLRNLRFNYCSNVHALQYLPDLPSVTHFNNDMFFETPNLTDFPVGRSFTRLEKFYWTFGNTTDAVAEVIFGAIAQTESVESLKHVNLQVNELTRMPASLGYFQSLEMLDLMGNNISTLKTGSVLFHANPPLKLLLGANPISFIEPSSFVGDFSHAENVFLAGHTLTRFADDVFLPVLEDMFHRGNGTVDLGYATKTIACDCHLAWLIRDHRHLLNRVVNGYCDDGKLFKELDPADYADC